MDFVAVDIGASSTRYVSSTGKVHTIPNNMVFIEIGKEVDMKPYDSNIENALEVEIHKNGESEYFPCKVMVGQMAERYSSNNDRPSVMQNKHKQRINYVSIILATALSRVKNNTAEDIELFLALPPIECKKAKDVVKEKIVGEYIVKIPKFNGGMEVKVNIKDVTCCEESFMAILSYFFDMEGKQREYARKYLTGNILSLDIGASTTDLSIVKNGRYLDMSGQTYKIGGNIARDFLIDSVRAEYGFDLPIHDAEIVMAEGRLQMGNTFVDVSKLVEEAKMHYAKSVTNQMQGYFRQVDIPIQSIRAIIVSGGGSMQSQYIDSEEVVITSKRMSDYITESLKEICPGVEVESYGDCPRTANISGLFLRAKYMATKAER